MPIVKVYGIPQGTDHLSSLILTLQEKITGVAALGVTKEQVTVLFPMDLCQVGLGEELIAEFVGLFDKPERTHEVLGHLAQTVNQVLINFAAKNLEQCKFCETIVPVFDQTRGGYASGTRP
ncbi:MAG: hypothetical protein ABIG32_01230, partial [Candidatus Uhrbacteria bacterium]